MKIQINYKSNKNKLKKEMDALNNDKNSWIYFCIDMKHFQQTSARIKDSDTNLKAFSYLTIGVSLLKKHYVIIICIFQILGGAVGNNKLWGDLLEVVKSEISPKAFNTWFTSTSIEVKENNNLIIYMANEFASDWVRKNYFTLIHTAAEKILEKEVKVIITSKNEEVSDTIASLM